MKHIKLFALALTLGIILSLVASPLRVLAETEPDDTPSQANWLTVGITGDTSATIATNSDVDWYKLTTTQDYWYVFETYNVSTNLSTRLDLYAPDGTTNLAYDYGSATGNSYSRIAWQASSSDVYYLRVTSSNGAGPYSVRALLKYDQGGTWDGTLEPNDTWQTASLLNIGANNAISTTIYPRGAYTTNTGDYDYFRFNAVLGNWYSIETFNVSTTLNTALSVFNLDGQSEFNYDYGSGSGNSDARLLWQAPQTGIFYARVRAETSSQQGTYSIRVLPKYDEGASWDANGEPDDEWVDAYPIPVNQTLSRSLYQRGTYTTNGADRDMFWFAAQAGYQYSLNLSNVAATLTANISLLGLDGSTVLASDTGYTNPGTPKSLSHTFYTSGIYYVRVEPYSSSSNSVGSYQLQVSTTGSPTLLVSKQDLRFVGFQAGSNPTPLSLVITNGGSSSFNWTASANQSWLHLNVASGSAGAPTVLQVSPDINGLSAGDYPAQVTVTAAGAANSPQVIQVSLRVDTAPAPVNESEPNDTSGSANTLAVGRLNPGSARLTPSSDVDWYKFTAVSGRRYIFETYNVSSQLSTRLDLYSTNGTTQLAYDYGSASGNSYSRIAWQAPSGGVFYLRVTSSHGQGSYMIRILPKYAEGATWDGLNEPNDNWETAFPLGIGRENAVRTTIYPRGAYTTNTSDYDWFKFNAILGRRYVIETFNVDPSLDTTLALFDNTGTSEITYDYGSGTGNSDARIIWQAPQTGDFFARVNGPSNSSGGYSIRVLPKYDEGATWDDTWEPDDEWVTASPINLNQTQSRSLYEHGNYYHNSPDRDYFWFYAQAGYQYDINLQAVSPNLTANVYLYSLDGTTILTSNSSYVNPGSSKSLSYTFGTPGNYYVRVNPYSSDGYGDYQLQVTSLVPAIQVNLDPIHLVGGVGYANSGSQALLISNSGSGSFDWSIATDQDWLQVDTGNGSVPPDSNVQVWANLNGLSVGTYTAHLTITAPGASNSPYQITVTLDVVQFKYIYSPIVRR